MNDIDEIKNMMRKKMDEYNTQHDSKGRFTGSTGGSAVFTVEELRKKTISELQSEMRKAGLDHTETDRFGKRGFKSKKQIVGELADYYSKKRSKSSDKKVLGGAHAPGAMPKKAEGKFVVERFATVDRLGEVWLTKVKASEINKLPTDDLRSIMIKRNPKQVDKYNSMEREGLVKLHKELMKTDELAKMHKTRR